MCFTSEGIFFAPLMPFPKVVNLHYLFSVIHFAADSHEAWVCSLIVSQSLSSVPTSYLAIHLDLEVRSSLIRIVLNFITVFSGANNNWACRARLKLFNPFDERRCKLHIKVEASIQFNYGKALKWNMLEGWNWWHASQEALGILNDPDPASGAMFGSKSYEKNLPFII